MGNSAEQSGSIRGEEAEAEDEGSCDGAEEEEEGRAEAESGETESIHSASEKAVGSERRWV